MNDSNSQRTFTVRVRGMHCKSCEVLLERKFKKIAGVQSVHVNQSNGIARFTSSRVPTLEELQSQIQSDGYTVEAMTANASSNRGAPPKSLGDYGELAAIAVIVWAIYAMLKRVNLLPDIAIGAGMSYAAVFAIGLVAATSTCIAVTGGLLLAVSAKYNELFSGASGVQKFRPHLFFNIGRVLSYTLFGALLGFLGSRLVLSTRMTGILTIAASLVMAALGLQILKLFPSLHRFQPRMPKVVAHRIHDWSERKSPWAPFILGSLTFFLPCGFTQALQLYVLSQGSASVGALTMLAFSLGTLPALLSLGIISSVAKGNFQEYFLKFSGVAVILLGLLNLSNGLRLTGVAWNGLALPTAARASVSVQTDPNVELQGGRQVVRMTVDGLDYSPYRFTVLQGVPVQWNIDGRRAQGCARVITVPRLGITEYLPTDEIKTIEFTPTETGEISFSCSMGMTTPNAAFVVVANTTGSAVTQQPPSEPAQQKRCDSTISDCIPDQQIRMEVSRERGFYPNTFVVKKGVPVEWTIDTKVRLGGCMGTLVIPRYKVAQRLSLGESVVKFTPTETGTIPFTCSMGSRLGQFTIID